MNVRETMADAVRSAQTLLGHLNAVAIVDTSCSEMLENVEVDTQPYS